jgi:heat-inducible transcriptional repressor
VQNRIIFTEKHYDESDLVRAANYFNQHYAGCTLEEVHIRMQTELKQLHENMTALMKAVLDVGNESLGDCREECVIVGEGRLLQVQDLSSNMANLRRLFSVFEEKTSLLELLTVSQQAQGVHIFIGGESDHALLEECSVITAPYEVDGQVVGTVGVIGPTRMAYERVIPIVDVTAKLLSSALSYH